MLENKKIKNNIETSKNSSQNKQRPTKSGHEKWKTPYLIFKNEKKINEEFEQKETLYHQDI